MRERGGEGDGDGDGIFATSTTYESFVSYVVETRAYLGRRVGVDGGAELLEPDPETGWW